MDSKCGEWVGSIVETSEWFDWLRQELMLGGICLPSDESAVLFIEQARHLASRVRSAYRLVPESLGRRIIETALIYQCWNYQRKLTAESGGPRPRRILPTVTATSYLRRIGESRRHHLMEANDGFRYVVTIPTGLWTEQLPATEAICSELARLLGLTVPNVAVVSVDPNLLRLADAEGPEWMQKRQRRSSELCYGIRYIDAEALGEDSPKSLAGRGSRREISGAMVFDTWVLNFGRMQCLHAIDTNSGRATIIFFDFSHCLAGADWSMFGMLDRQAHAATPTVPPLISSGSGQFHPWIRKVLKINMNQLWELAFEIPQKWYGGNRSALGRLIGVLEARTFSIAPSLCRWVEGASSGKKPASSAGGPTAEALDATVPNYSSVQNR